MTVGAGYVGRALNGVRVADHSVHGHAWVQPERNPGWVNHHLGGSVCHAAETVVLTATPNEAGSPARTVTDCGWDTIAGADPLDTAVMGPPPHATEASPRATVWV